MALIHYTKPNGVGVFLCGGALMNQNNVITAAHCVRGQSLIRNHLSLDSVRLGEHDLRTEIDCEYNQENCADPVMNIQIAETFVHENYSSESISHANDIALIRLARPVPFTDFIQPICLPITDNLRNRNYDNVVLTAAGFGKTEYASQSYVKLKWDMSGFNLEKCSKVYKSSAVNLSNKTHLCAGGEEGRELFMFMFMAVMPTDLVIVNNAT